MYLGDYYPNIEKKFYKFEFSGISFNSKTIKKGNIFFAVKGNKFDGNKFINIAINNGAKIIISETCKEKIENNILYLKCKNIRKLISIFASKIYKKKPKNLIAVTGTNGKTSVTNFYYKILKLNKIRVASLGTLGINGKNFISQNSNTTLDPIILHKHLDQFKKNKIDHAILEASSHGLKQNRLDGLKFNIGIFTNISRDHLDYHKTYKDYLNSKLILFKKLVKKGGYAIFINNQKNSKIIKKICNKNKIKTFTIGKDNSDLIIKSHKYFNDFQEVNFSLAGKDYYFKTKLIGKVQIENLIMAISAAYLSKIELEKIIKSVEKITYISGRFENIKTIKNNSKVILDYAHTPDALKNILINLKDQFKHRDINIVFGCGGERDKPKRKMMGMIANSLCNKIYLTDDNPRSEDPKKIRKDIKSKISKKKLLEIGSREQAIKVAINELKSNEILLVAGKGHELYQEYKTKKFFSDKQIILKYIKIKNKTLSQNWKTNIINENLNLKIKNKLIINEASINSRTLKKNNIFFGIKGKKIDGNKYADEALKKRASICILDKNYGKKNFRKIFVKNSLKTFSNLATLIRKSSNIFAIAITGSVGKTSLKELIGQSLKKTFRTTFSKQSFNNKYGVPLSLFRIRKTDRYGVFEVGMDKKGEIDYLSNIIKPDLGIITNINYAHSENFKNLRGIAEAKSEMINNISENGTMILNKDDKFYNYFKKKAENKKLKVVSFSKNNNSDIKLKKIQSFKNNIILSISFNRIIKKFIIKKQFVEYIENILAALATLYSITDLRNIDQKVFFNFKQPEGRGNFKKIKLKNKLLNILDESYNSNPLSLSFSIKRFNNLKTKNSKIMILGDMLELGKFSKKLHEKIANVINTTSINKVYVYGKDIIYTFNKIRTQKKGRIFKSKLEISRFIKDELKSNNYLMIKGSNSTGLNEIVKKLN